MATCHRSTSALSLPGDSTYIARSVWVSRISLVGDGGLVPSLRVDLITHHLGPPVRKVDGVTANHNIGLPGLFDLNS